MSTAPPPDLTTIASALPEQGVARGRLWFIAFVVSLGGFVFGFDAAVISGVVGYVSTTWQLDVWQQGLLVSAPSLAAIPAALTVAPLSDVIGRRRMLVVVAWLYLLSGIGATLAPDYLSLVLARALGGFAFGSLMLTPVYMAEIAPARLRGMLVSVGQLNIVIGLSAAYFCNYVLVALSTSGAPWVASLGIDRWTWRWMLGLEIVPAALWLVLLFFVPESPRWLALRGRLDAARRVLRNLYPAGEVENQLAAVAASAGTAADSLASRLREVLSPRLRFVLFIGLVVGIAQQITGINAVLFFATSIFELSGIGRDAAFAQAVWVGLINVVFTGLAMLLIDRLGRRPLLIGGLVAVVLSLSLAGWGFQQARYQLPAAAAQQVLGAGLAAQAATVVDREFTDERAFRAAVRAALGRPAAEQHEAALLRAAVRMQPWMVLTGILSFVAAFAISLGPVMWVLLSEIFPNRVRGVAMALVGFVNALVSFGVQFLFPWELSVLGNATTFFVYAATGVVALLLVVRYLPETKGRTLEEIEHELAGGRTIAGAR